MITIIFWLWRQEKTRTLYTASHVNIAAAMVRRNLSMPHRIACVTDMPEGIGRSVEIITPPGEFLDISNPRWSNGRPQCYRRLSMRSEEHTSELQSLMRISYAVFCLKTKN